MTKHILVLPDGTEISSGMPTGNVIQSVSITDAVNDAQVLSLGSTCASSAEINLITPSGEISIGAGVEIILYRENDAGERKKIGVFITEKPTRPTANTMRITAYDRITKLDKDLSQWLFNLPAWPYSLYSFATMVCEACGLQLVNEEIPHGDYLVKQFSAKGISGRKLMKWVGQICGRFCRATPDGDVEFAWYEPAGVSITPAGDKFYYENTLRLEDYQTYPIEKVQVHLTEDDVGAVWPDGPVLRKGGSVITVDDAANAPLQGLTLYGKTTQDGTPTPENPVELVSVGESGAINVKVCGKNLWDARKNGSQYIGDWYVNTSTTNFSLSKAAAECVCCRIPVLKGQKYVFSSSRTTLFLNIRFEDENNNVVGGIDYSDLKNKPFSVTEQTSYIVVSIGFGNSTTYDFQLEHGATATDFEPYKEAQTLTASTPNGLPGIPVASGGNYTDENGQQWICDEIDFARGVYVQYVIPQIFDGHGWLAHRAGLFYVELNSMHKVVGASVLCDRYTGTSELFTSMPDKHIAPYQDINNRYPGQNWLYVRDDAYSDAEAFYRALASNPITVMYALATPIETPLTEEELTAYAALHTNKPNTTVYNDAGAYMEVTYMTGEKNTYRITGNYLLTADATDDLQPIAQSLYEQMKDVSYTPCSVTIAACDELQPGHIVQIADMNGKSYTVYVMRKTSRGMRDTIECMGPYRLDSTTIFNEQTYAALSGKVLEVNLKMEGLLVKASDLEAEQQNLNSKITETSTSVLNDCNQILMTALQSYVHTSNYEEFRQTVEAQVKLLRDEFSIKFEETDSKITEVDGDLQEKFNQIATIFEFTINGFKIGKAGSPYKIFMDDNEFAMSVNDTRVLWFELSENSQQANIPELSITTRLNLLGFLIDRDSYGNVNCEYIGGE